MSIDSLAHQCAVAAKYRTSIDGTVFALFGSDAQSVSSTLTAMNTAFDDLQDAGAHLWLNAEPETVRLGGEIATAVAALIEVHALGQHKPAYLRWLLDLLFGPPLAEPAKVEAARAKLATARTALMEHTRERFNLAALPDPAVR